MSADNPFAAESYSAQRNVPVTNLKLTKILSIQQYLSWNIKPFE